MYTDDEIIENLKKKFSEINPLLFHRSVEYASSPGELFDILDLMPEPPLIWDEISKRWIKTEDLVQIVNLDIEGLKNAR